MGKTQSKRSVDITTEGKKVPEEEVTGKLEKIDDPDQKQLNGDGAPQESAEAEKKDADESENDKDLTTEKSAEAGQGDGDGTEPKNTIADSPKGSDDSSASGGGKEGENMATAGGTEEISPLADESSKKPKKEKVKKKWSFRSISFGKKDKQKPTKSDEAAAENVGSAMNGDTEAAAEKVEGTTESVKKEDNGEKAETDEKPAEENFENGNGNTSEKEVNGQKTPASTPTEEKSTEVTSNEITTKTTTATAATAESNTEATANEINQTEKQTESADINAAAAPAAAANTMSNGAAANNNGIGAEVTSPTDNEDNEDMQTLAKDKVASAVVEASADAVAVAEKIKSIPNVLNDGCEVVAPHHNGTSACDEETTEPKAQIEVKTRTVRNSNENLASSIPASPQTATTTPSLLSITPSNPSTLTQQPNADASKSQSGDSSNDFACHEVVVSMSENLEASVPTAAAVYLKKEELGLAQNDTQEPPPLPISPPPSQVSFFALDEHPPIEGADDNKPFAVITIPSTKQPETDDIIASKAAPPSPHPTTHQNDSMMESIKGSGDASDVVYDEKITTLTKTLADIKTTQAPVVTEANNDERQTLELNAANNVVVEEDMKRCSNGEEDILSYSEVAKAVIDEVTEQAAAIVQKQFIGDQDEPPTSETETGTGGEDQEEKHQSVEEKTETELSETSGMTKTPGTQECDEVSDIRVVVVNVDDSIEVEKTITTGALQASSSLTEFNDEKNAPCADAEVIGERNDEKDKEEKDCSTLGAMKENEKLMMVSHSIDEHGDKNDGDSISPAKEIANVKDMKENAAVEITTQDLPVTCE